MRDYDSRDVTLSYSISSPEGKCAVNPFLPPEVTHVDNDVLTYFKGRENLVPSNHHKPTTYGAWRWKAEYIPFKLLGRYQYTCVDPSGQEVDVPRYATGKSEIPYTYLHPFLLSQAVSGQYRLRPNANTNLINEVKDAVLSEVNNSDINVGQTLGELLETGNLLLSRTLQLAFLVKALRQGKLSDAYGVIRGGTLGVRRSTKRGSYGKLEAYRTERPTNAVQKSGNLYLEMKFGWAPLISDLFALANGSIEKTLNKAGFPILSVTRTRKNNPSIGPGSYVGSTYYREGECEQGCKMSVSYKISDGSLAGLNALGLVNPVQLAWELVPLSFVVDWLLHLGSFLSGLTTGVGLTFLHGYTTTWTKAKFSVESYGLRNIYNLPDGTLPKVKVSCNGFRRVLLTSWPKPGIWINLSLNPSKLATLLALVHQRG